MRKTFEQLNDSAKGSLEALEANQPEPLRPALLQNGDSLQEMLTTL